MAECSGVVLVAEEVDPEQAPLRVHHQLLLRLLDAHALHHVAEHADEHVEHREAAQEHLRMAGGSSDERGNRTELTDYQEL